MSIEHIPHRRYGLAVAALAGALLLAVLQPTGRAEAEAVFTFEGGGFGHSVGMSQFGAYGMALDGYTWQEIVTHYYSGTSVEAADPRFTDPPLWVGIVQEYRRVEFLVRAIGDQPVPVTITRGSETLTAQPGETIAVEHLGAAGCRVSTPAGSLTGACTMFMQWNGWVDQPTTALQLEGCSLPDWNAPGGTVYKPCTYARGTMFIHPDNNSQSVNVSLAIDVEDYVLGISESPYGWGDTGGMAALQAQAVAARSYAIHRAVDRGDPASRPWCWCQIYDTPIDQNYVGWGHGTQTWIEAVRSTEGMVVTHPSEIHDGAPLPIEAFYSSSTFGWTENSEHGFTQYVPYLRNVDDHWSLDPRVYNHSGRWTRQFSASSLASRLPGMSSVTGLEVTACSPSGAALEITFTGSGGPRAFTTRELRGHLGLRSMQVIRAGAPLPAEPACPQPGSGGGDPSEGGPVTAAGLTIDDDPAGDSVGNGNGVAECGEIVEVYTAVRNEGDAVEGVGATLSTDDPYVSIRWNTTSTYPDIPLEGTVANDGDWDLVVDPDTPAGHTATLGLQVTADNGGPWDLTFDLPIACAAGPGPLVAAGLTIDDDPAGDSVGNGNGVAECGEIVEVYTLLHNQGALVGGVEATLSSDDPYVSIRWNTTSTYPDIPLEGTVANDGDWDLVVDPDTPAGHTATLGLQITAGNGGPWDLTFDLPTACSGPGPGYVGTVAIPDIDDSGAPELVNAVTHPAGRWVLKARDAGTGGVVARLRIASPSWQVLDLEPVPGEPTKVAVLLTGGRLGRTRSLVADLATLEITDRVNFFRRRDPVGIAPISGLGETAAHAALVRYRDQITRLDVRTAEGTTVSVRRTQIDPVDLAGLDDVGGGSAGEVAVLGIVDGSAVIQVVDPETGDRLRTIDLGPAPPVTVTAMRTAEGGPLDAVAVVQDAGDEAILTVADAATGTILARTPVPVTGPVDVESLPWIEGTGAALAVLGSDSGGTAAAVVVDPFGGTVISEAELDDLGYPVGLGSLSGFGPSGIAVASLGAAPDSIEVHDALTGTPIGDLRVP